MLFEENIFYFHALLVKIWSYRPGYFQMCKVNQIYSKKFWDTLLSQKYYGTSKSYKCLKKVLSKKNVFGQIRNYIGIRSEFITV